MRENQDIEVSTLFAAESWTEQLAPGAFVLHGFIAESGAGVIEDLQTVVARAPFRHMITPGGFRMSVAMTNCGELGWISDRRGYRYTANDPESAALWPPMPHAFRQLAVSAASEAGFIGFVPDACLINRYEPGARLTLHQDRNEIDYSQPIVSVSLGLPAAFLFGGPDRKDRPRRVKVEHGDVVVWGGPSRLNFHGVAPLKPGTHPATGPYRVNLTFRKAG